MERWKRLPGSHQSYLLVWLLGAHWGTETSMWSGAPDPSGSWIWPRWCTWVRICLIETGWGHHLLQSHLGLSGWASSLAIGKAVTGQSGLEEKEEVCDFSERNAYWLDAKCARLFKSLPLFTNSFSEGSKTIQEHRKEGNRTRAYKQKDSIVYQVWTDPLVYISLLILEENSVLRFAFSSALNTAIMFILFRF